MCSLRNLNIVDSEYTLILSKQLVGFGQWFEERTLLWSVCFNNNNIFIVECALVLRFQHWPIAHYRVRIWQWMDVVVVAVVVIIVKMNVVDFDVEITDISWWREGTIWMINHICLLSIGVVNAVFLFVRIEFVFHSILIIVL